MQKGFQPGSAVKVAGVHVEEHVGNKSHRCDFRLCETDEIHRQETEQRSQTCRDQQEEQGWNDSASAPFVELENCEPAGGDPLIDELRDEITRDHIKHVDADIPASDRF